jgi:hypothetical protein
MFYTYEIELALSSVLSGAICSIRCTWDTKLLTFWDAKLRTFAQTSEYQVADVLRNAL